MEPLSALGLTASVAQLLDFVSRLLRDMREIYGAAKEQTTVHVALSDISEELSQMAGDVMKKAEPPGNSREYPYEALPYDDQERSREILYRLCQDCQCINEEMQAVLERLQARGTTKLKLAADSFLVALKGLWSGNEIEALRKRLLETRQQIMTALLVLLWWVPAIGRFP